MGLMDVVRRRATATHLSMTMATAITININSVPTDSKPISWPIVNNPASRLEIVTTNSSVTPSARRLCDANGSSPSSAKAWICRFRGNINVQRLVRRRVRVGGWFGGGVLVIVEAVKSNYGLKA